MFSLRFDGKRKSRHAKPIPHNEQKYNLRFICFALLLFAYPFAGGLGHTQPGSPQSSTKTGYRLPFPEGKAYKVIQGNNGQYGHKGHAEFAYDFQMPTGSTVVAARGGEVVKIEESYSDGTRKPGEENYVMIRHADGTFGRYYHLTKGGALVAVGDRVAQGDRIGLSGNSGASFAPHLHFDVTKECYDWGCQTIRIDFENAKENPLKEDEIYEALGRKPERATECSPRRQPWEQDQGKSTSPVRGDRHSRLRAIQY